MAFRHVKEIANVEESDHKKVKTVKGLFIDEKPSVRVCSNPALDLHSYLSSSLLGIWMYADEVVAFVSRRRFVREYISPHQVPHHKVFSSEMAFKASTRGLDILAGYGVTLDYDMQRYFRDSRQCTFSPISNEMARNFIAEQFGLPKSY